MDTMTLVVLALGAVGLLTLWYQKKGGKEKVRRVSRSGWMFGPIIGDKNYSVGLPSRPTMQGAGWAFDFPGPDGEVDAVVNYSPGPMASPLTARYTVTGGGFRASGESAPGRVGLCLQRKGDDWSGEGKYQQYRLYGQSRPLLVAGEGQIVASAWTDVKGKVVSQAVVDSVLADLDNVSLVFGGTFASHGVYATEPSRFTLLSL